jgi:hypothetical protein
MQSIFAGEEYPPSADLAFHFRVNDIVANHFPTNHKSLPCNHFNVAESASRSIRVIVTGSLQVSKSLWHRSFLATDPPSPGFGQEAGFRRRNTFRHRRLR